MGVSRIVLFQGCRLNLNSDFTSLSLLGEKSNAVSNLNSMTMQVYLTTSFFKGER